MLDCIIDGLLDTLKLLPYLLVTFIILEFVEHKLSSKNKNILLKNKKFGPLVGGLLGAVPQCGFSSMASGLFSNRVITIGTLVAVFLSTSDEMIPIMLGEHTSIPVMLKILVFKVITGIIVGIIVDLIFKKKNTINNEDTIKEHCEHEHCHCEKHNIFVSSIIHTLKIGIFVLCANLAINLVIYNIGEDSLKNILLNKNILNYFVASLIGLIPNCASSVIMTELYVSNLITIGTLISGLLTGSGLGILLLFKENKNIKENVSVLSIIYFTGVILGIIVDLII